MKNHSDDCLEDLDDNTCRWVPFLFFLSGIIWCWVSLEFDACCRWTKKAHFVFFESIRINKSPFGATICQLLERTISWKQNGMEFALHFHESVAREWSISLKTRWSGVRTMFPWINFIGINTFVLWWQQFQQAAILFGEIFGYPMESRHNKQLLLASIRSFLLTDFYLLGLTKTLCMGATTLKQLKHVAHGDAQKKCSTRVNPRWPTR